MPDHRLVSEHYSRDRLSDAIRDGLSKLGKRIDDVTVDDLGPVDEFHIGGRPATEHCLDQLAIDADHHVLDVGCGLGGSSRFAASRYGCRVTGIDLTAAYVDAGNTLCDWVGLGDRITLAVGDATSPDFDASSFDRVFLLHVGMNIADKKRLMSSLYRVLVPGGLLGVYDIMQVGAGNFAFPMPWASEPSGSAVARPDEYREALVDAGFDIAAETNRRDFALAFFAELKAKAAAADGPPPLGLHLLMGDAAPVKLGNMIEAVSRGVLAPVEIIARRPHR